MRPIVSRSVASSVKPYANMRTISGEKTMPSVTSEKSITTRIESVFCASSRASFSPLMTRYSVYTGMNDIVSAPSATSRRSRFGIRNATKNPSSDADAPK